MSSYFQHCSLDLGDHAFVSCKNPDVLVTPPAMCGLLSLIQIYGLKVLVKSFLPIKDSHLRTSKLKGLLGVVAKLLTIGEVSEDIKSRYGKEHPRFLS